MIDVELTQAHLNYVIDYVAPENRNIPAWQLVYSNVPWHFHRCEGAGPV